MRGILCLRNYNLLKKDSAHGVGSLANRGSSFPTNVGMYLPNYMVSHPKLPLAGQRNQDLNPPRIPSCMSQIYFLGGKGCRILKLTTQLQFQTM